MKNFFSNKIAARMIETDSTRSMTRISRRAAN